MSQVKFIYKALMLTKVLYRNKTTFTFAAFSRCPYPKQLTEVLHTRQEIYFNGSINSSAGEEVALTKDSLKI